MTIKELLGKTVEELEAMSQPQLEEYCAPYIKVVDNVVVLADDDGSSEVNLEDKETKKRERSDNKKRSKDEWLKEMQRLAQTHGVNLDTHKLPKGLKG